MAKLALIDTLNRLLPGYEWMRNPIMSSTEAVEGVIYESGERVSTLQIDPKWVSGVGGPAHFRAEIYGPNSRDIKVGAGDGRNLRECLADLKRRMAAEARGIREQARFLRDARTF